MAITYDYPLTGAKGLCRVLYFEGLDFPVVITPALHGKTLGRPKLITDKKIQAIKHGRARGDSIRDIAVAVELSPASVNAFLKESA